MELVIEATPGLTSACTERQSGARSRWDPQTDLVSDLTAKGHEVRADFRSGSQAEGVIFVGRDKRGTYVRDLRPSRLISEQSVYDLCSKEPYCNPWAALADYPASILQHTI